MPLSTTYGLTGTPIIDGLLSGFKWVSPALTYSFPTLASQYASNYGSSTGFNETASFAPISAQAQIATRAILANYQAVSGLTFTEVTVNPGTATIRLGLSDAAAPTAYAWYPDDSSAGIGGDVWLSKPVFNPITNQMEGYDNPVRGNYEYATYLHELGHAMGLKHGHEIENFSGVTFPVLPVQYDAMEYTVMTYRYYQSQPLNSPFGPEDWGFAQTLMMGDIAAIQQMYGANFTTNATASIYTFSTTTGEMFINGVGQGAPGGNRVFLTIWDGGGIDTYDFSNYTTNESIDLTPGGYSLMSNVQQANVGGGNVAHGNVYNALQYQGDLRSLIENANGGSGNDIITGNQADNILNGNGGNDNISAGLGNDTLNGGAGNDTLTGGSGNDRFIFTTGADIVTDFLHAQSDQIDLTAITSVHTLADLSPLATQNGANTILNFGGGNQLTLNGITFASLVTGDFMFAASASIDGDAGDNTLAGTAGNDLIHGLGGNDNLQGLLANDTLDGGAGIDTANYSETVSTVTVTLTDLSAGHTGGSSTGAAGNDTLIDIENITGGSGNDVLTGNDQDNVLAGGGGNDNLTGGAGNDSLFGQTGTNIMAGGAGDDIFYVQGVNDIVTELAGGGNDTAYIYSDFVLAAGSEVEYLGIASAANLTVTGNELAQRMEGNAGNDTLNGGNGSDTLNGFGGNDTLNGGGGADILAGQSGTNTMAGGTGDDLYYVQGVNDVVTEAAGEGYDAVYAYASFALSATSEIEYIDIQSATGISVTGSDTQQFIVGGAGDDTINGAGGIDVINGGNGNDVINGGDGNDVLHGAGGNDTVSGNAGDDTLLGQTGTNTLIGGTGNDSYYVQGTNDIVTELAGEGADAIYAYASFALAASSEVEFIGVQTATGLTIVGSDLGQVINGLTGDDNLDGGGGNDTLNGSSGNDIVSGGAGDDNIYGSLGNDTLNGNGGNDTLVGDSGTNTMAGGAGNDTYYVDGLNDVVIELAGEGTNDFIFATQSFALAATSEVENLRVSTNAGISVKGSNTAQLIVGGAGNDRIEGAGGADTIYGGLGADTFVLTNVAGGFDSFEDFVSGTDFLEISAAQFGGGLAAGSLGAGKFTANATGTFSNTTERFVYNTSNHQLIYDADGNGGANSSVLIAIFDVGTPVIGDFKVV